MFVLWGFFFPRTVFFIPRLFPRRCHTDSSTEEMKESTDSTEEVTFVLSGTIPDDRQHFRTELPSTRVRATSTYEMIALTILLLFNKQPPSINFFFPFWSSSIMSEQNRSVEVDLCPHVDSFVLPVLSYYGLFRFSSLYIFFLLLFVLQEWCPGCPCGLLFGSGPATETSSSHLLWCVRLLPCRYVDFHTEHHFQYLSY